MTSHEDRTATSWPFVRTMIVLDEVDSTSNHAATLLRSGESALPLCVWATRQTRGRGRGRRSWWSGSGSLTFTLALDSAAHGLAEAEEPLLALTTAVAVIDALAELGLDSPSLGIRWPNDIEAAGKKLGGILPERIEITTGRYILIGVGLNVATEFSAAPPDVKGLATSVASLMGRPIEDTALPRLLSTILDHVGLSIAMLSAADPALAQRWNQLDLLRDQWVAVRAGTQIVAGLGGGIDQQGALCVEAGSRVHRLVGGTVLR